MRLRSVLRDLALLCLAVAVGWWVRGAETTVLAQRSSSDAALVFQLTGIGSQQSLAVFNPQNHTLYVYPRIGEGNSHISCEYSFTIANPGLAIDRQNCPVGEQVPHR